MRVAFVSPYSWTYPGGVTRHIEALATELAAGGHDVRGLAPFDPDVRRTALLHRGARPQPRPRPEWLVPLGPTSGWAPHRAVSHPHPPAGGRGARGDLLVGAPPPGLPPPQHVLLVVGDVHRAVRPPRRVVGHR